MEELCQETYPIAVAFPLQVCMFKLKFNYSFAADRPKFSQLIRLNDKEGRTVKLIEGVAAKWEQLAYTLQFSSAVVRTVQRDTNQDCTAACEEVLYRWVSGAEGTRQPVSWATLIECLRDCDFRVLASDLEKVLCQH